MRFLRNVPSTASTRSDMYFDRRPVNISKWGAIKRYLWNSEERTVCNRGCTSWCFVLVFYTGFLSSIIGIFFGLTYGAIAIIKQNYPDHPMIPKDSVRSPTKYEY